MNRSIIILVVIVLGAWLFYRFRYPRYGAGEQAPDFAVTLRDNQTLRLSDFRGKYLLLQFWGSWCGPCRAENPHLAELYKKYQSQGFEIFSIGIEKNAAAWQRAIERDGMVWPYHSADLQAFDSPVARQFNVRSIPATFLLNPQGIIIGMNLSPDQLDKILSEQLQ